MGSGFSVQLCKVTWGFGLVHTPLFSCFLGYSSFVRDVWIKNTYISLQTRLLHLTMCRIESVEQSLYVFMTYFHRSPRQPMMEEEHIATTIIDVTAEQISLLMAITGRPKILLEPASFWLIGIHFYIHWLSYMAIISNTGCFLWWSTLPVMRSTGNPQIFIGRVVLQVSYHVWWMLMTNRYAAVTSCPQNHGLPVPPAHSPTFVICWGLYVSAVTVILADHLVFPDCLRIPQHCM